MKNLFSRRILCLSKTQDSLRVIEIEKGSSPPKILNFGEIHPLPATSKELAQQLEKLLKEQEFIAKTVYSALLLDGFEYKRLSLPHLKSSELKSVVKREVLKLSSLPFNEISYDYKIIQTSFDKGSKRNIVIIAVAPKKEVEAFEKILIQAKLVPELISSIFFNISETNAVKRKPMEPLEARLVGSVFLTEDKGYVVFNQEGWPFFSRDFVISHGEVATPEEATSAENDLAPQKRFRVMAELSRSVQHIQQNFREFNVKQIVFSGYGSNSKLLSQIEQKERTLEVLAYQAVVQVNTEKLQKPDVFLNTISQYAPALGLSLGVPFKQKINFIPVPTWIHRFRLAWSGVFIVLLTMGGFIYWEIIDRIHFMGEQLPKLEEQLHSQESSLSQLQAIDKKRQQFKELELVTNRQAFEKYHFSYIPFKALSQIIPSTLLFTNLDIKFVDTQWKGTLLGLTTGPTADDAKENFQEFYQKAKRSILFTEWELAPLKITDSDIETTLQFHLNFQITKLPYQKYERQ